MVILFAGACSDFLDLSSLRIKWYRSHLVEQPGGEVNISQEAQREFDKTSR
ncbi:hypothetical protein ACFLYE_04865 [Chloroflexota bacterium]